MSWEFVNSAWYFVIESTYSFVAGVGEVCTGLPSACVVGAPAMTPRSAIGLPMNEDRSSELVLGPPWPMGGDQPALISAGMQLRKFVACMSQ